MTSAYTPLLEQKAWHDLVSYGMLISVPSQDYYQSAYAVKVVSETYKSDSMMLVTKTDHYYARIRVRTLKDICSQVRSGSIRAMGLISSMYSLGFVLPRSSKLSAAWNSFSYRCASEHIEVDEAYAKLIVHAKKAIANSPEGEYLYSDSYYDAVKVFYNAFDYNEVPIRELSETIRQRGKQNNSRVLSYAVPAGVPCVCIYKATSTGAHIYDVLTRINGNIVSILDYVSDIGLPSKLSRDSNYVDRTNSISDTKYKTFAVSGQLCIARNKKPAVVKFLNVNSVKSVVEQLAEGSWSIMKSESYRSKARGLNIRNIHNPGNYLDFVATNVFGLRGNGKLTPIDLSVCLGQHLSSCGFRCFEPSMRTKCLFLQATNVYNDDIKKTVKHAKQVAQSSEYAISGLMFSMTNSENYFIRFKK